MNIDIAQVAKVCHEANRTYCETIGDHSQKSWEECEEWQRESARIEVRFTVEHPEITASGQHDSWLRSKESDGWKYGPQKDATRKEHPCMVPYEFLPKGQKTKDFIFKAIVTAFLSAAVED